MKPLNFDKNTCSPISSNCVIWQGPDIECINLCKGDTITDVVYKLATELCTIMDVLDLTNYDLKCFAEGICPPTDFKVFLQLLIDKVCTCCGVQATPQAFGFTVGNVSSEEIIVPVNPAFYYTNEYGDTVTTMPLSQYVITIGNKVAQHITDITALQNAVASNSNRISALEVAPPPTVELPVIIPTGVLPSVPTEMADVLVVLESQFVQLRNATGTPNEIYTNIQKQPAGLNDAKSLANPSATMASLPGWTSVVNNEAASFGNVWIVIQDMRNAIQNLIATYLPSECNNISLTLNASISVDTVTMYITGNVPSYFSNTYPSGTQFKFADTLGNMYIQTIDILGFINDPSGYVVDLSLTSINTSSNITLTVEPSFTSSNTGSECKSVLLYTIVNQAACPSVTYGSTATDITFEFTSATGNNSYTIDLYTSLSEPPISSQTVATTEVTTVTGIFSSLTPSTNYLARVTVVTNGVTSTCEITALTTLILAS